MPLVIRLGTPTAARWLRLGVLAVALPLLIVVALGLRRPTALFAVLLSASLVGYALCASLRPARCAVNRLFARSRGMRLLELILWNLVLAIFLAELSLAAASLVSPGPLLLEPNARAERRIEGSRLPPRFSIKGSLTNSRGYNDTEWVSPKPADTLRILALGDSFGFGIVGYERNFLTRLEERLSGRGARRAEVINLGIPSIDPEDYLQVLIDEGIPLDPDLVLISFYTGNDYQVRRKNSHLHLGSWRLYAVVRRVFRLSGERAVLGHRFGREEAAQAHAPQRPDARELELEATFSVDAYLRITTDYLPLLMRERSEKTEARIADTVTILGEIVDVARPREVVIAVIPSELQVNPEVREETLLANGLAESDLDLAGPTRDLRAALEPRGVMVIDLLPSLTAAERQARCYQPRDTHWNAWGNEVAADALVEALEPIVRRRLKI